MTVPENVPKGYSWLDYCLLPRDVKVEDLLSYTRRSELTTPTENIVIRMQEWMTEHPEFRDTPAGICVHYILQHTELHAMLKEVNDGSYRTNRLLLKYHSEPWFDNYENQRFLEGLFSGTHYNSNLEPTRTETLDLLQEVIDKDGVIFVQFSTPSDMFPAEEEYPDEDF